MVKDASGERIAAALATAPLAGGPRIGVIETASYAAVMTPAAAVQQSGLVAGIVAVLGALVVAVLIARSLAAPLTQMTTAVQRFGQGEPMQLPLDAGGEAGVLARAFAGMAAEVTAKAAALRRNSEILDKTIASMADAVLLVDAEGKTLFANPTCKAIVR